MNSSVWQRNVHDNQATVVSTLQPYTAIYALHAAATEEAQALCLNTRYDASK